MWNVECVRCGEMISAESPDDIEQDVDGNPRHDECPYADEPNYPVTVSVDTSSRQSTSSVVEQYFPHLTPQLEDNYEGDVVPRAILTMGAETLTYRVEADPGDLWNADVSITAVNGSPLASNVPRLVYECEGCGERVDGSVVYLTDGYLPFSHESCGRGGGSKFKPVEVSHLDSTIPSGEADAVLERYQEKYSE